MVYQIQYALVGKETRRRAMASLLEVKPIDVNFSLKEHIYERLKDAITSMNIYAEDADLRLDERQLAAKLNASRTPVREALARLAQEGLVTLQPRRGAFIARKTVGEILEMIIAWAAIESMAARLATANANDREIASLRQFMERYANEGRPGRIDEYSDVNIRFHQRIIEIAHCSLLKHIADGLFIHMRAIRARTMSEGDRAGRSIVDHLHIIEALEKRDTDLAERLVREHTLNLHAHVRQTWTEPSLAIEQARA